jgi:hypothetical protein
VVEEFRYRKVKRVRESAFRLMLRLTFKALHRVAKDEMQEITKKLQRPPLLIKESSRSYLEKC